MIEEVVYTSVKKGLYPGQEGYCIVARSKALSRLIEERLSALSNYRHLEDPAKTPTNYSHLLFQTKTDQYHLFSRVGDGGNDFSERRCFFAHHIAESDFQLLAPAGPAWTCANKNMFYKDWTIKPGFLRRRELPIGEFEIEECRIWKTRLGNDDGAKALAESVIADSIEPFYVVFEPSIRLLPLFVEAIALIPKELRWDVTFSTFFTGQIPGIECQWRGVLKNSVQHRSALQQSFPIIDLT